MIQIPTNIINGNKPPINLSVIEEEDKQFIDRTNIFNSNSDNEMKRNASSNSLKNPQKLQKKSSYDPGHFHKKPSLMLDVIDDMAENIDLKGEIQKKSNETKGRSLSEAKKLKDNSLQTPPKVIDTNNEYNEKNDNNPTKSDPTIKGIAPQQDSLGRISEQSSKKNQKFMNEMKNFVRKKWTLSEFELVLLNFLRFKFEATTINFKDLDQNALLQVYGNLWMFFFQAMQIILYTQKESKSLLNKFRKNLKDSIKIKDSFAKYHRFEEIDEFLHKKKWKGYLEEMQKCQEIHIETIARITFIVNFLENTLENYITEFRMEDMDENAEFEKNSKIREFLQNTENMSNLQNFQENLQNTNKIQSFIEHKQEMNENLLNEKVLEIFSVFEANLKTLNTYTGLTTYSEERLAILSKIDKKESFLNFIEFFNDDVKNRHQNDLKYLLLDLINYLKKISKLINTQVEKDKVFHRQLNENCLLLSELTTIYTKKVQNLVILRKCTSDKISSIVLPFYENLERNLNIINESERNFTKILIKIKKIRHKIRFIRDSFTNNFFLSLREKHALNLITELSKLRLETLKDLELIPYFKEFPNYELEILNMQANTQQYQEDFQSNEEKDLIRDKVIWLAGKLHNLRVFFKELQDIDHNNAILKILEQSLETQLNSTYKLYDFLLKILNSAHSNELQKIKLLEQEVKKTLEILSIYYETLTLPSDFSIEDKLLEMKVLKQDIDNLSLLFDLPDIYSDICMNLNSQLEREIEKLSIFEDIREKGKEKLENNRIRNVILSLQYEKKSTDLEVLLQDLEKYASINKYISRINITVKIILERIEQIIDVLKVFDNVYTMFLTNFVNFSENYEQIKKLVGSYHEVLLSRLGNSLGNNKNREDRELFRQCAEFFYINTKNYFQTLIPENVDHIYNQTTHLLREIRGKIDNFYENRENLRVMAVGYTRQINIITSIDQYLKILEKLRDLKDENPVKVNNTFDSLKKLKGIVELMLKPCQVAYLFEEFLDDLIKNKTLTVDQRIQKLKDMLKNLDEKLRNLVNEERKIHNEEKISSIFVYVKDDIKKVNEYITRLLPDIDEYAYFYNLNQGGKLKIILQDEFIAILNKMLTFKIKIDNFHDAIQPLQFNDRNKINDFIQEYYYHWYGHIHSFLNLFDFDSLAQIINCYNFANPRSVQKVIEEYMNILEKVEKRYLHNKNLMISESKEVRHMVGGIKNTIEKIDLSIFTLSNLVINAAQYKRLNKIQGIKEFCDNLNNKFQINAWKELVNSTYKLADRYCNMENSNPMHQALFCKEISDFKTKIKEMENLKAEHAKWHDVMLKAYQQLGYTEI